jgi:hypothetical protein
MFKNSDNDNDTEVGHMHAVEEYFEGFTLRTSLRKTMEKKVSIVEKRQI